LVLVNGEGAAVNSVDDQMKIIIAFYDKFYNSLIDENLVVGNITPFRVDAAPLTNRITKEEVERSAKALRNGRASGSDGVCGEMIKYGGERLFERLAELFNKVFETNTSLDYLLEGLLVVLNKPNKDHKVENTRPITLLNIIRKMLSTIVLRRIDKPVENFVSPAQSGFRRGRQTTNVVWTYRWLQAIATKFDAEFHMFGIDFSKAFDSLNRTTLMGILEKILEPTELRIIQYLLSDTVLKPKTRGKLGASFRTTIGTPQGDALSPVLFTVYLEHVLREVRPLFDQWPWQEGNGHPPKHVQETAYADDVDYITTNGNCNAYTLLCMPNMMAQHNLKLNSAKTEYVTFRRKMETNTKKLGSMIDSDKDVDYRIQRSCQAFTSYKNVWNSKHIRIESKLRLYDALVRPVLMYNMAASAASIAAITKIDSHHRRQLRSILGIRRATDIHMDELYARTKNYPISIDFSVQRLKFLGHMLRQGPGTPAYETMQFYYKHSDKKYGDTSGNSHTMAKIVQKELDRVGIQIRTQAELKTATELATERKYWSEQVIDKYVECRMNEFKAEMATRKAARQDNASQVAVNSQE
jgi:hypothetical protein